MYKVTHYHVYDTVKSKRFPYPVVVNDLKSLKNRFKTIFTKEYEIFFEYINLTIDKEIK